MSEDIDEIKPFTVNLKYFIANGKSNESYAKTEARFENIRYF